MPTFELTSPDGSRYQIDADSPEIAQKAFDHAFGKTAQGGTQSPSYSGTILPVSRDAQGNPYFDINAGLTGSLIRAFKAPGDAYTGKLPVIGPARPDPLTGIEGNTTPQANARAAEFAALFSPVNPAIRAGDLPIPGPGMATMQRQKVTPPTAVQLKETGGAQLNAARSAGIDIRGDAVANMARGIQSDLQSGPGIISKTAPKTYAILDELAAPPEGGFATISGVDAARRGLSGIKTEGGTEGLAAGHAVRSIDDFLSSLGDSSIAQTNTGAALTPEQLAEAVRTLKTGRDNYASAMRSNDITGALDRANTGITERAAARAAASNSGQNIDNAMRQRVASLLQRPKEVAGYSGPEIAALNQFVEGGALRNAARRVGNIFGGGGGMAQAIMGALGGGAGAAIGHDPLSAAIGAATPVGIGIGAKALQNGLARRDINFVDQLIRSRSPLYQDMVAQQPALVPNLDRNIAALRALGIGTAQNFPTWGALVPTTTQQ